MNYEQKYKEALERARNMLSYKEVRQEDMEYLFPELKESDDEKIRKALIAILKSDFETDTTIYDISVGEIIDWLEKQDNQREQLINKACDVLVNCIEDYMLRRMEVWNEEGKKQTLENIRKKLKE